MRYLIAVAAPLITAALLRLFPEHGRHLAPLLLFANAIFILVHCGAGASMATVAVVLVLLVAMHHGDWRAWRAPDIVCALLAAMTALFSIYSVALRLLRAQRQRSTLMKALCETPAPLILRDAFGSIILWSRGAEQLYGWSAQEAEGRYCDALLRAEMQDGKSRMQREALAHGGWSGSLIVHARDGRRLHIYSRWIGVSHEGDPLIFQFDSESGRAAEFEAEIRAMREKLSAALAENQDLRRRLDAADERPGAPADVARPTPQDAILQVHDFNAQTPNLECATLSGEVLVVDDEIALRKCICRFLERAGMLTHEAGNYEEAMAQIARHGDAIALLLTDLVLPGKNGRMIAEEAERRIPGVKVIYASGYPADVVSRYGVMDHRRMLLQKPFTRERLIQAVQSAMQNDPTVLRVPPPDFASGANPANL